ncbi:MAG: hypothetical protein EBU33_10110 [Sphingobacteriia bacterium]|nr:hypothetical protein [Sphingobacteriia bacterium]
MASSPKQAKEKIAEKLGLATTAYLMATKSSQVRINPSKRKKTVSQKISQLVHEGYPQKQAVAVALSEKRAGKVKSNPMEGALLHLYGNKYGQVKQYGNGLYTATILQKVNTGIGEEMDYYDSKEFKTKAGAARWLANSGKKTTRTNPSKRSSSRSAVVPNPRTRKPQKVYSVSIMQDGLHTKWMGLANFFTFAEAENYSRYLSKQHPNWAIRVHDTRAMK